MFSTQLCRMNQDSTCSSWILTNNFTDNLQPICPELLLEEVTRGYCYEQVCIRSIYKLMYVMKHVHFILHHYIATSSDVPLHHLYMRQFFLGPHIMYSRILYETATISIIYCIYPNIHILIYVKISPHQVLEKAHLQIGKWFFKKKSCVPAFHSFNNSSCWLIELSSDL